MENVLPSLRLPPAPSWRAVLLPKEHGSWSLALEPLAFGLIAAPSAAGAALAVTVTAAFLARRPLRLAMLETKPERRTVARRAFVSCTLIAAIAMAAAVALGGWNWLIWLTPALIAGGFFLAFDLRNAGREEPAEVAGATAFALLPAAFAILAGRTPVVAIALAMLMCGRAVPTVLCIRAALRIAKKVTVSTTPALLSAALALVAAVALARHGVAPWFAVIATAMLAVRAVLWLALPRPALRGSTLGMIEAILGVVFVVGIAATWPE